MSNTDYILTASLHQLIGDSPDVEAIEHPTGRDSLELEKALSVVMVKLLPYPAVAISDWFWDTVAGQDVVRVQWMLYGNQAISIATACRILWGKSNSNTIRWLHKHVGFGRLGLYHLPKNLRNKAWNGLRRYLRRSEIEAFALERGMNTFEVPPKKKRGRRKQSPKPPLPPETHRTCASRSKCLHPDGPLLPLTHEFFYRNRTGKQGFHIFCRPCMRHKIEVSAAKIPKGERLNTRKRYDAARRKRLKVYGGGQDATKRCASGDDCANSYPSRPLLPATLQYFAGSDNEKDGFNRYCKACLKRKTRKTEANK